MIRALLPLLLLPTLCSTTPPPPTLTAAQAAKRGGQLVTVRARVARVHASHSGYTFLNLDKPIPACQLEIVLSPDVRAKMGTRIRERPTELVGRVIVVKGVVQAAEGSTAQIWLSKPAELSVAP